MRKFNKFGAFKCGGFDSKLERRVYDRLLLLEESGCISNLTRQPKFEIIPRLDETYLTDKGKQKTRCIERAAYYTADFQYDMDGFHVVCEVKGEATRHERDYVLRRKLIRQKLRQMSTPEEPWRFEEVDR